MTGRPSVLPVFVQLARNCNGPGREPFGLEIAIDYIRSVERQPCVPPEEWLPVQPRELRSTP